MKEVVVVATITLKEHQSEGVLEALQALHKATHKEDTGCIQYDLHQDIEKENTYVFVETWANEASLREHMGKVHFKVFQAALASRAESVNIQKLEKFL